MRLLKRIFVSVLALALFMLSACSAGKTEEKLKCTVTIDARYVVGSGAEDELLKTIPSDGMLLKSFEVEFNGGDNAFDVTLKAAKENGIAIDSVVDSYGHFIKGINGIENTAYGEMNYWLFSVNGEFSDVGSDQYVLEDGDEILWYYGESEFE